VLCYHTFLDYAFSFAAGRNPLITAATAAPEGTTAAYPRDSSSKRGNNYL